MRRGGKILITVVVILAALLAINTIVINSETKPAGVDVPGGKIMHLSSVDMQVVDQPATGPGPEGAPIVLLHCYGCSLGWWDDVVPLLNRDHRIIRFDLAGFGGSQKPSSGYSMTDQARDVAEALNKLGVEGAVVVGHSMGGFVATALAQSASQLVDRVAVISTPDSASADASLPFGAKLAYTPVLGQAIWRLAPSGLVKKQYSSAFAPGFDYEAAFKDPDQLTQDHDAMTYRSYKDSHAAADKFTDQQTVSARITAAAVPFMAILGSEDQIVDTPATESAYKAIPGAEVHVLDGVGHSAQLEAPKQTAKLIENFAKGAELVRPAAGGKGQAKGATGGSKRAGAKRNASAGGGGRQQAGGKAKAKATGGGGKKKAGG